MNAEISIRRLTAAEAREAAVIVGELPSSFQSSAPCRACRMAGQDNGGDFLPLQA